MGYYIKCIWGPHGHNYQYPKKQDNLVGFFKGRQKAWREFINCDGFLLFEREMGETRKSGIGSDALYAYGKVDNNQEGAGKGKGRLSGKEYFSVRVIIPGTQIIDPRCGVKLEDVNKILGRDKKKPPCQKGGILPINKNQFDKLCAMLDLKIKRLEFNKSLKISIIGERNAIVNAKQDEIVRNRGLIPENINNINYKFKPSIFKRLEYQDGIIIGPVDHCTGGVKDPISKLTNNKDKYPPIKELDHDKPIGPTALGNALDDLLEVIYNKKNNK